MSDKLSVIISVGKAPGLQPPLPGAYTGHAEFRAWAVSQGHDVLEFTDEKGRAFNAVDIAKEVQTPIVNQSLSELWIYFAGHGECSGIQSDFWLLKRDAALPGDVIDVKRTRHLATLLGIPRVIIIADACRTTGDLQSMASQENSASILPALNITAVNPAVECLFATQPGSPSLEVREENAKAHGIFTTVLMRALRGEVPAVKSRSDDSKKLVVRLQHLRPYLEEQVPVEAATLGKGRAQMPNIIPGGSREPYAIVGDVPNLEVRIDTIKEDGTPAPDTRIRLVMLTSSTESLSVGEKPGPSATFNVPSGCAYESTATGPYQSLLPELPLPMFRLDSPKQGRFRAVDGPNEFRFEASGGLSVSGTSIPSIGITRVITDDGGVHSKAPEEGVFQVVTYDALNGGMASQLQRFTVDDLIPKPIATRSDEQIKNQILKNAQVHGRRGFETRTGLTLIGQPEVEMPDVAAPPGALEGVFFEDSSWHLRGNHSAGMIIQVGANYLTGAVFHQLVGAVRLSLTSRVGTLIEDLSYVPASNSHNQFDLNMLDIDRFSDSPRDEIDALQLIANQCARNGFFEVTIDDSVGLAGRMRPLKHHNPIFGLLAAYAYDKTGRKDQIIDMIKWFIRKEQSIPFDLVMLAGISEQDLRHLINTTDKFWNNEYARELGAWVVPTWPILTQGWSRISPEHLERFPVLKDVQTSLLPGFWSAASGVAGERFFASVKKGELKWI